MRKKILSPLFTIIACLTVAIVSITASFFIFTPKKPVPIPPLTIQELFDKAVADSMLAESSEIRTDLIALDGSDNRVITKDGKFLLSSWHKYPDSYVAGEQAVLNYGEVWVFSQKEMESFLVSEKNVTDYAMRFRQLIGLRPDSTYTHFSLFWVDADELYRPAYDNEIDDKTCGLSLTGDNDYLSWFNGNILNSYYGAKTYPWTRLGYTYDWADNGEEYGLSEFIIKRGSTVEVIDTINTQDYINYRFAA